MFRMKRFALFAPLQAATQVQGLSPSQNQAVNVTKPTRGTDAMDPFTSQPHSPTSLSPTRKMHLLVTSMENFEPFGGDDDSADGSADGNESGSSSSDEPTPACICACTFI